MTRDEIFGYVLLAALLGGFLLARRRGRQALQAAVAAARAEGYGEGYGAGVAVAAVHVHQSVQGVGVGASHGSPTYSADDNDHDRYRRFCEWEQLQRVHALRGGNGVAGGVGELLDGVQRRPSPIDAHHVPVPRADAAGVPAAGHLASVPVSSVTSSSRRSPRDETVDL